MTEQNLTTGPAMVTGQENSRKITIEVFDEGKISLELSHAFKTYEVYGILVTSLIDIFMKNSVIPLTNQATTAVIENSLDLSNQLATIISSGIVTKNPETGNTLIKEIENLIKTHNG